MRQVVKDCELELADAIAEEAVEVPYEEDEAVELLDADDTVSFEEEVFVRREVQSPMVRVARQRIVKAIAYCAHQLDILCLTQILTFQIL